jgi:hypothetical protein
MYRAFFQARHCLKGQRLGLERSSAKAMRSRNRCVILPRGTPRIDLNHRFCGSFEIEPNASMYTQFITLHI